MTMTVPMQAEVLPAARRATSTQAVVVHAHCYQPPREDPWLEVVEAEPSASPDHDWNARIDRECYARLGAAQARRRDPRVTRSDADARTELAHIINLYAWCSFDVGATLCEWLDTESPQTLAAMQAGDAASVRRTGFGNAIAAPYHHVILPLASRRDKVTEVRWGIADFRRRFRREPEGMWLPECAVDDETLEVLAQEGIRFTILAPYQVRGADNARGMPVRWRGASGRELAILPYDGNLAGEVAFGGLLRDAGALSHRLAPARSPEDDTPRCTTLATDGETFGHHHRGGDSTLAEALVRITQLGHGTITNAAALIAQNPPTVDVSIVSPSAWSCAHGVERWRSNCGCRLDGTKPPAQEWRGPLRVALSSLADHAHDVFDREGRTLFRDDPWAIRDAYGVVVGQDGDALLEFVREQLQPDAPDEQLQHARRLLELERATLRMFTSCAWFFDEVERIETRQVLRYAARALELSGMAARLAPDFVHWLEAARGSAPGSGTASELFVREALPHRDAAWSVAAGAMACASQGITLSRVASFDVSVRAVDDLFVANVRHRRTGRAAELAGTVFGAGAATTVSLSQRGVDQGASHVVPVYEFPESVIVTLLTPLATDELALA
jgi:alpha-amylase/alpha-mannosidase (GH57 family)